MADYHIEVSATAEKQLRKLEGADQQRITNALKALAVEPRPQGCRKLRAYDDVYRIRTGVFRIIYSIEDDRLLILVLKIGHRQSIYRQNTLTR